MKIFDAHVHSICGNIDPERLLEQMAAAGIYGGSVFSPWPESPCGGGEPYEVRMQCLDAWTKGYEGRLYPVLFIHPLEKDASEKARDAAARGVYAFKVICDCFYPYDEPCMELMQTIAELKKPVMFHSGVLWDGRTSSQYNRPMNFERLIEVPGLRFSLAHCSWPWYDECLALYGKFLNCFATNPDVSAEMFLDLTPGTPIIYRRDLITKLFNCGYDTPHNILYGTDCTANDYRPEWAASWIKRDTELFEEVGACSRILELYLAENYHRFLGLKEKDFTHVVPVPDRGDAWSLEQANAALSRS